MAAPSKTQFLNEVHTLLKRRYRLEPRTTKFTILEAVIYAISHEGTTREEAEQSLNRFREQFFDWNEVRVSSIEEIQSIFVGLSDAEERAGRVRRFLRQLFEKTYGFILDGLAKKPLKESIKALKEYDVFDSDYIEAAVVLHGLGGHAMPVDAPVRRALIRLEVVEEGWEDSAIRSLLERAIPKNKGGEFIDLLEELSHDTCVKGVPDCPRCELRKVCPTGISRAASDKVAAKSALKNAGRPPLPTSPPDAKAIDSAQKGNSGSSSAVPSKLATSTPTDVDKKITAAKPSSNPVSKVEKPSTNTSKPINKDRNPKSK